MEAMQGTGNLISSEKVEGTNVYNRTGDTLGSIHDLMIDKTSGHVVYAIMSFGGFLGMGNQYHPLPWSVLKYDTNMGGYVVNLDNAGAGPHMTPTPNRIGATEPTRTKSTTITESARIG